MFIYALSLAVLIAIVIGSDNLEYIAKTSRDVKYLGPLPAKALTLELRMRRLIRATAE